MAHLDRACRADCCPDLPERRPQLGYQKIDDVSRPLLAQRPEAPQEGLVGRRSLSLSAGPAAPEPSEYFTLAMSSMSIPALRNGCRTAA
jgi:hypothetical protein